MPKTMIGEDDEPAKKLASEQVRTAYGEEGRPARAHSQPTSEEFQGDPGESGRSASRRPLDQVPATSNVAVAEGQTPPGAPSPWGSLTVAIIDDAMHPPRLDRLSKEDADAVIKLFAGNAEVQADVAELGCAADASVDEKLRSLAESQDLRVSFALVGAASADALRMIDEHRVFLRLLSIMREEVQDVAICDPYQPLPDLAAHNLILLDYYLNGPAGGGELAVEVATSVRAQANRASDQQIVLMSSLESVRDIRGKFRTETDLTGSAFAFIGKPDLNEAWKVKAHLGMLERARPYAPAFTDYRAKLDEALVKAREDLLTFVDDLDIGDYAFLQGRALMKDGHPLGDYVFWLLSSQLMALAFERDEMRERQRALDTLEFVGAPFAATEPSTLVANLLHSALVSRNLGPLGPHPRAKPGSPYIDFPLVQLGDVFLDAHRTKAIVVMSADCDLAFAPMEDRPPDADTPVMLVPGKPIKLKDVKDVKEDSDANTDGILHREEVYRIVWEFSKYRSIPLGKLKEWLEAESYDITNRDRLRPLFGLKLQQEFGAHLMRVGPPVMPPMTTKASGRVIICAPEQEEVAQFTSSELMMTRFKKFTWLRVTPRIAGLLRQQCEELRVRLNEQREAAVQKKKVEFTRKIENVTASLENDQFWIDLLNGVELNGPGSVKTIGPLGFVVGPEWTDTKVRVMLEIREDTQAGRADKLGDALNEIGLEVEVEARAVSTAA